MAAKVKTNAVEEAHFRVDENERRLVGLEALIGRPAPKSERVAAADPVEDAHQRVDEHARRIAAIEQMFSPENLALLVPAILKALGQESEKLDALIARMDSLIGALFTPTTRTATLELPSGPAIMTVREGREKMNG